MRRASNLGRSVRISIVTLSAGLLAMLVLALPPVIAATSHLSGARAAFVRAAEAAHGFDVDNAKRAFREAESRAADAKASLGSPLVGPARYLPVIRDNLEAATVLADAAATVAVAAQKAADAFPTGTEGLRLGLIRGRIQADAWFSASTRLAKAADRVWWGIARVRSSRGVLVPPLAGARSEFLTKAEQTGRALRDAADIARLVPVVFGADRSRTWFLAIQNPAELRATGGLLGAFGILKAEGGRLALERFESNLGLPAVRELPEMPEDFLARYERFEPRLIWQNANVTPDFPTAARMIAAMWRQSTDQAIDGVIAIDAVGLAGLLEVVGPITMPEVGQITADNFLSLALNDAYVRFPEKTQRVDFLLEVGREVWRQILSGEFTDPRAFAHPLGRAAAERHIEVWIPGEEAVLKRLGVGGGLDARPGADYLLVVGQNAAANKLDYYARRRITYRVQIGRSGEVAGLITVRLENPAPSSGLPRYVLGPFLEGDPPGLNRSYTSVYVPLATGVVKAQQDGVPVEVESHREGGLSVASYFLEAEAGQTSTLSLSMIGRLARPGEYRLLVRRQPTLRADDFRLEVVLPPRAFVLEKSDGMQLEGRRLVWEGPLARDREFQARFGWSLRERLGAVLQELDGSGRGRIERS